MNTSDTKIFNDIAGVLAESINDWCGEDAWFDSKQIPEVRIFAHSFIARFKVTGPNPQSLLIKIAHQPNQADLCSALENESLRAPTIREMTQLKATSLAFTQLGDPELIAIKPLAYLERWNAIVMFELQAQALRNLLVSPQIGFSQPKASAKLISHIQKATKWILHYHSQVGNSQINPVSKPLMQVRLNNVEEDVKAHLGTHFDAPKYLTCIKSKMDNVSGMEPVAQLHGDFNCSNILVTSQGQICVIDHRPNSKRQSIYNELATLIIDLSLKPIPMLTGGIFSHAFLEQSQKAIIETYFKAGEYSHSLFNFYCACEGIFKWSMYERDFVHGKKMRILAPLARPVLTRYMRGFLNQFINN